MVFSGILSIITGVIFYIYGNNLNNDIDAQMNYLFGEGKTNPGSTCVTIGIVFLVAGALLLITAAVKNCQMTASFVCIAVRVFDKHKILLYHLIER